VSRSNALRAADVRAVFQLVGECRELGDDPIRWRQHLLTGLARLTGGGFGVAAEVGDGKQPSRYDLGTVDLGADSGFNRAGWLRALAEFATDAFFNPFMNAYFDRAAPGAVPARAELVPDREWYPSFYYQGCRRTLGADHSVLCLSPIPGTQDDYCGLYLLRPIGERDFSGRERAVAAEAMALVAPLLGGPLARFGEPSPSALSPRLRQVLRCLLEGDADKQVAARLGLTRHTVNQYTKTIFRHFGVGGRAELLARWVRRGWGGRCAWADDTAPF
jgi:DNA-binding CsgD family transcriptional regulator